MEAEIDQQPRQKDAGHDGPEHYLPHKNSWEHRLSGSARVSACNASPARTFGVTPKQSFRITGIAEPLDRPKKSPRSRDAIANTRDACATRQPALPNPLKSLFIIS